MRTEIALVNLRHQRVVETRESFINLEPDHLEFKLDFDSEVPVNFEDEALGYKSESTYYHASVPRTKVVTIEMTNMSNPSRYVVTIIVGGGDDIKLYFKPSERDKAEKLRQDLVEWLLNKHYLGTI